MSRKPRNAADADQVKEGKRTERRIRDQEINDLRYVLNDERGRRFLWRLLGECGVFRSSFETHSNLTSFYEGKRSVGLFLTDESTKASIDAFLLMQKEGMEREEDDE